MMLWAHLKEQSCHKKYIKSEELALTSDERGVCLLTDKKAEWCFRLTVSPECVLGDPAATLCSCPRRAMTTPGTLIEGQAHFRE